MKNSIVQKAEDIISDHDRKIKDFETVCHAGICPICGESLMLHHEVTKYTKDIGCIFKKEVTKKRTDVTVACPKGHKLIHPKGHNVADPGYYVWDGCLNKDIGGYHSDHYDGDEDDFG